MKPRSPLDARRIEKNACDAASLPVLRNHEQSQAHGGRNDNRLTTTNHVIAFE